MASSSKTAGDGFHTQQNKELPEWMTLDKDSHTKTPVPTEITGTIPKWLSGNLYRNGSGVFKVGDQQLNHIFDGFALIHRYIIRDGEVKYQSRILDSDSWVNSCKANRLVASQFTVFAYPDPCKSIFDRVMSYLLPANPDPTDNTAVNVVEHGDKLYAISDIAVLNEIDPETLKKKSQVKLNKILAIHLATAHPHFDADGTMYNLATNFNPSAAYAIVAIPPKQPGDKEDVFKKASLLTHLPSRFKLHISYNHSFGMTEDYFVILEQPLTMQLPRLFTSTWRREAFVHSLVKFPGEKLLFRVVRRSDNQLLPVVFEADPAVCFHFINCHEVDDHLVVDLCAHDDIDFIHDFYLSKIKDGMCEGLKAFFKRYVLPIKVTEADPEVNLVGITDTTATAHMSTPGVVYCTPDYITDEKIVFELPRINYEKCNGKKYRYAYGIAGPLNEHQVVKVDIEERKTLRWKEPGCSCGEPIFVPKPDARDEDDGVLLSPVLSYTPNKHSYLLVLDAKTLTELGRAVSPSDVKIAASLHGSFLPDKRMKYA